MALPVGEQLRYWGIAAAVLLVVLWLLGDVLLPFVIGGAIAYFLDPIADRLERLGLGRVLATVLIMLVLVLAFVLVVLAVIPSLVAQAVALVNAAPTMAYELQNFVVERFPEFADETSTARQTLARIAEAVQARGLELLNQVLYSAVSLIGMIVFMVIVPVVAFYLLMDWDRLVAAVDRLLPRDHAPVIREIARDIDAVLASFVRGQVTVCLILGTFYAVALMLVGLQFGLVIGAVAGAITFIPYVGAIVGGTLAIGVALFQFWGEWGWIAAVAGIFLFGQFIEGNFLTPKLMGHAVGLHPVWLLLALMAFGSLFGFVGMLVAVPVAAMIGVLARFGIAQYSRTMLYRGLAGSSPPPEEPAPGPALHEIEERPRQAGE
jgi:predicted PurR-regulated permease PerM